MPTGEADASFQGGSQEGLPMGLLRPAALRGYSKLSSGT